MAKVVKVIELMSQSSKSWEDAAQGAVNEASKTLRNIRSIYIEEFTATVSSAQLCWELGATLITICASQRGTGRSL